MALGNTLIDQNRAQQRRLNVQRAMGYVSPRTQMLLQRYASPRTAARNIPNFYDPVDPRQVQIGARSSVAAKTPVSAVNANNVIAPPSNSALSPAVTTPSVLPALNLPDPVAQSALAPGMNPGSVFHPGPSALAPDSGILSFSDLRRQFTDMPTSTSPELKILVESHVKKLEELFANLSSAEQAYILLHPGAVDKLEDGTWAGSVEQQAAERVGSDYAYDATGGNYLDSGFGDSGSGVGTSKNSDDEAVANLVKPDNALGGEGEAPCNLDDPKVKAGKKITLEDISAAIKGESEKKEGQPTLDPGGSGKQGNKSDGTVTKADDAGGTPSDKSKAGTEKQTAGAAPKPSLSPHPSFGGIGHA